MSKINKTTQFCLIAIFSLILSSCINIAGEPVFEEIERIQSPDGIVDAILMGSNCGATCSGTTRHLYLAPTETKFQKDQKFFKHPLFTADNTNGLKLQWQQPRLLEIQYNTARIFKSTNFWYQDEIKDDYVVEIQLAAQK